MVQFAVKNKDENLNIYVNAFVTDICYAVEHQSIDFAKQTYSHLRSLDLGDSNPNNLPLDINTLIGVAHYWNIIGKQQIRGEYGPVVLGSKRGYILIGPIENSQSNITSSNIVSTVAISTNRPTHCASGVLDWGPLRNFQFNILFSKKMLVIQRKLNYPHN